MRRIKSGILNKLFQFIIFLLPTQLAYHFWPSFSFVNGVRVDYLSPAIYVTDTLIFVFVVFSLIQRGVLTQIKNKVYIHKTTIVILSTFIFVNIAFAFSPFLAFIKWSKIFIFTLFALTLVLNKKFNIKKLFPLPFFLSLVLIVGLQIMQIIKGGSIGGLFYFFGERAFNTNTIGIALVEIFGKNYLRPYSVFPHPNALGGYLLVGILLLIYTQKYLNNKYLKLSLVLTFIGIILSFSQMVWTTAAILIFIYLLKFTKLRVLFYLVIILSFVQLGLPYFNINYFSSESIIRRIELLEISNNIISNKFVFGAGLNNFIPSIPQYSSVKNIWWLQPVHNIFILMLVETGMIGILVVYKMYTNITQFVNFSRVDYFLKLAFLGVLLTGFADHYWLTLQQNMLLLTILVAFLVIRSLYAEK